MNGKGNDGATETGEHQAEGEKAEESPRWREDFPIAWERAHYVSRRELTKFLTLGSGLLAGASATVAIVGEQHAQSRIDGPRTMIGRVSAIAAGGSVLFRYPTEGDPCILVRDDNGVLCAYSQVCTHLSCAVVHRAEDNELFCPCHHGHFDASSGRPTAGPPIRRLPRIRLEIVGDEIFAVGKDI